MIKLYNIKNLRDLHNTAYVKDPKNRGLFGNETDMISKYVNNRILSIFNRLDNDVWEIMHGEISSCN